MTRRLRLVLPVERPLAKLSYAEKLARAKAYLQRRGIYVLDRNAPKPKWGVPGEPPKFAYKVVYRGAPTFMERFADGIKTLWSGQ
jgi:hypothetical protein